MSISILSYTALQRRPADLAAERKGLTGGRSLIPAPIPDATWQAGVTRGNDRFKPALNGEPIAGAFAAKEGELGWIKTRNPRISETVDSDPFCDCSQMLRGVVTLLRIPLACR